MYDLIVVHDFEHSRVGDRISDPDRVAAILANPHRINFVQKVPTTRQPEPEAALGAEETPLVKPASAAVPQPKAPEPTGLNVIK